MGYWQTVIISFREYLRNSKGKNDHGTLLCDEAGFSLALMEESRRAERSGRISIVMSIDIGAIEDNRKRNGVAGRISSILSSSTRETDAKGWVLNGQAIGVLLTGTGLSEQGLGETMDAIAVRVWQGLRSVLDGPLLKRLQISFQLFPGFAYVGGSWRRAGTGVWEEDSISFPPGLRKAG